MVCNTMIKTKHTYTHKSCRHIRDEITSAKEGNEPVSKSWYRID